MHHFFTGNLLPIWTMISPYAVLLFHILSPAHAGLGCVQLPHLFVWRASHHFFSALIFLSGWLALSLRVRGTLRTEGPAAAAPRARHRRLACLSFRRSRCAGSPLTDAQGVKIEGFTRKSVLDAAKQASIFLPRHLVGGAGSGEVNRQVILRQVPVSPTFCHPASLVQVTEKDR